MVFLRVRKGICPIREHLKVKNISDTLDKLLVCHFSFLKQFDVICDLFNRDCTERGAGGFRNLSEISRGMGGGGCGDFQ